MGIASHHPSALFLPNGEAKYFSDRGWTLICPTGCLRAKPCPCQQLITIRNSLISTSSLTRREALSRAATAKEGCRLVRINDDRPPFAFAGIWTEFKGDRGTKSKPIPGPHLVYGLLTTTPNAVVEPIRAKAMPMILTTPEEYDVRMRAVG
jgi:hypothetical protein